MSDARKGSGEGLLAHFEKYLGSPVGRGLYKNHLFGELQVLSYANVFCGCMVFATFGLSKSQVNSVEVLVPVDSEWQMVPLLLASACFFCLENDLRIARGTLVRGLENVSGEFANRTGKVGILFVEPYAMPDAAKEFNENGGAVNLLYGILLTELECKAVVEKGVRFFEAALESSGVDVFEVCRSSVL